ncbi:MAG TPA: STAS domain-containing protein [Candidatus Acidoferrales bacterium]|nr:STAS domain-containing protein [Candidatus Acidoferrales bacterium]
MPNNHLTLVIEDTARPGLKTVALVGSLSLETVANFNQSLREEPEQVLILNLEKLEWLDSAGVGALVQLLVRREKTGKRLALTTLSVRNNAVLQVAQVLKIFPVFPTLAEAHTHFGKANASSGA